MTKACASPPVCAVGISSLRAWLRAIATRAPHLIAAACLALCAASAFAQSSFSSSVTFDRNPADYAPNDHVTATITLNAGSSDVYNVNFSDTLPAGVTFTTPVLPSACGGTASSSGTTFSLTGGAIAADTSCTITLRVTAAPATTTTYTISVAPINYSFGPAGTGTDKTAADFTVSGGIPPTFTDSLPGDGTVGEAYSYYVGVDGSTPVTVTVTGLPPGLTYDSDAGAIIGTPALAMTYTGVHFHADNGFAPPADATYTIVIHPAPLSVVKSFSPASIVSGDSTQLRIALTHTTNVSLISFTDPLPSGMSAADGSSSQCGGTVTITANLISYFGNLSNAGTCTITVPVAATSATNRTIINTTSPINFNDGSTIAGVSGSLLVNVGVPPHIVNGSPPGGTVGFAYGYLISVTGTTAIKINVTGLPPGLTFSASTGMIAGTPTKAGTYSGTITAHNAFAPDATRSFTIVITNPPLAIVTTILPPISGGDNVHVPVVAKGGIPPYTFDVLSGQLPPGLTFDPQGFLGGVPTLPGVYTFTVRVTDSVLTKATRTFTINIDKGTPLFTFDVAPNPAVIGQPVVATATLAGGTGAAAGNVQVWVAHSDERCPVITGDAPVAAKTLTAALGAGSQVKFTFADLGIDHYQLCATYGGDVRYKGVSAGPYDVFVIKGALLAAPTVDIAAPATVKARETVTAQVAVKASAHSAIAPSGSVLLRANGVPVGTVALTAGVATFSTPAPGSPGYVTLSASYLGDGAFPPSVSAPAVVAVTRADLVAADPVPTLSGVAMAMLVALLAAVGVALRRRRRG